MPRPPTHPFLRFSFEVSDVSASALLALGEAMSKCEHLAGVPLKPNAARQLAEVTLTRGVQGTVAIEGNTLSTSEVREIVEGRSAGLGESRQYQEQEVKNVLGAIREIDECLRLGYQLPITVDRLRDLNRQVLDRLPEPPEVVPGQFRQHNVAAGTYRAPDWNEVPDLMRRLVAWLDEIRAPSLAAGRREDRFVGSVLAAILAHLYLAWIHGFGNGNGRLARLIEVQILSESGVVPIVATNLLSDFYNKTRSEYYRHLDLAQRDPTHFVEYAIRGFRDELRQQIHVVRAESLRVHWESYVYEIFRTAVPTPAKDRQRELVLAMPIGVFITPEQATELTVPLARRYASCGERTPARDLNDLTKLHLVEKQGRRYRARREVIEAFLPPVASGPTD